MPVQVQVQASVQAAVAAVAAAAAAAVAAPAAARVTRVTGLHRPAPPPQAAGGEASSAGTESSQRGEATAREGLRVRAHVRLVEQGDVAHRLAAERHKDGGVVLPP